MSLLTPLYVLGLLAVSLPVVFHLIRRAPKGNFEFSSLMFLSPSPPRLTRRSRLDNLFLLLLRGLVIGLLAFAFARPFLRQTVPPDPTNAERQRVAIVVDTSASMRRGDLWQQATAIVDEVVAERRPHDQVALFTCDDALQTLVSFDGMTLLEPAQRRGLVKQRLAAIGPTWAGTRLGRGLLDAVDIVNSVAEPQGAAGAAARRIVLITDFQQGSRLDELAHYAWPADVPLDLRIVRTPLTSNAGLQLMANNAAAGAPTGVEEFRVSVINDGESAVDQFELSWLDNQDRPAGPAINVYVPAGESRVVTVSPPKGVPSAGQKLRLRGDACDFDNTLYLTERQATERTVVYLGAGAADDPAGLRYYLQRALSDGAMRSMTLRAAAPAERLNLDSPAATPLVVVAADPSAEQIEELRKYLESGGTLLWVLTTAAPSSALPKLLGLASVEVEEASVDGYTMLGKIAFDHPLFAPMAGPQFSNFTQIYFWHYRRVAGDILQDSNIIARFENGDPAVIERRLGNGQIVIFTSGWKPADSQLARSWKFVLLMTTLADGRRGRLSERSFFVVNDAVPLRDDGQDALELTIIKPGGAKALLAANARTFADTELPGVYTLGDSGGAERFAVNLDPAESRTTPLAPESLEQFGTRLVNSAVNVENSNERQQLHDVQLESRQKIWQWLIAAALAGAILETWVAGRITKKANK